MADAICSIEGCERPRSCRGWCNTHYERWRVHGTTDLLPPKPRPRRLDCTVDGCAVESQPSHGLCHRHYKADWYRRNRGRALAERAARKAAQSPDERQRRLQMHRDYYQRNRERALARHAARMESDLSFRLRKRERVARWKAENPDRRGQLARKSAARRYERLRSASVEPVDFSAILAEHGMTCHICDGPIQSRSDLHFDHVIPLAKGGPHSADNIRPSHARCNLRKGVRLIP